MKAYNQAFQMTQGPRGPRSAESQRSLDPYRDSENLAEIRMYEFEKESKCEDGFIFTEEAVHDVYSYLPDPVDYETVWTRIAHFDIAKPKGFKSIGYEPTYFTCDHFSASCDCMLIPRWHGTDQGGTLFLEFFEQLNQFGLFPSTEQAKKFLDFMNVLYGLIQLHFWYQFSFPAL